MTFEFRNSFVVIKLRFPERAVRLSVCPSVCAHNLIPPAIIVVKLATQFYKKKKLSGSVYKTPPDRLQRSMALSTADTLPQINIRDTNSQWIQSEVRPETYSHSIIHRTNYKCPVRRHRTSYKCPVRRHRTSYKCPVCRHRTSYKCPVRRHKIS